MNLSRPTILTLAIVLAATASAPAETIDSISGLTLHLSADELGLSDGDSVASWGSLTASGSAQPTYVADGFFGKPTVSFDGANDFLAWSGASLDARTIFMVGDITTGGGSLDTAISNGNDGLDVRRDATTLFYRSPGHNENFGDFGDNGTFNVNNVSGGQFVIDQHHLVETVATSDQVYGNFWLGQAAATGGAANRFWTGGIAEVVVFDRVLTSDERDTVVTELSRKYGMGYNYLTDTIDQLGATATASAATGGQGPTEAIDNNNGSKWYTGSGNTGTITIQYDGDQVRPVHSYTVRSANDVPDRDPASWTFEGSNDGSTWTILDTRSGVDFTQRFQELQFTAENRQSFEYYRFNMTNSAGTNGLQLSELELFALENVALNKTATQSTTLSPSFVASRAVDGTVIAENSSPFFTHTDPNASSDPWWMVDLEGAFRLESIVLHNRDDCCQGRLQDITVELLDLDGNVTWTSDVLNPGNALSNPEFLEIIFDGVGEKAGMIRVSRSSLSSVGTDYRVLSLGEVQAFGYQIPTPAALPAGLALLTLAAARRRRRSVR